MPSHRRRRLNDNVEGQRRRKRARLRSTNAIIPSEENNSNELIEPAVLSVVSSSINESTAEPINLINSEETITNSDVVIGQSVVQYTRKQYARGLSYIEKYCSEKIPTAIDEFGKLIIPMRQDDIEQFFGDMASVRPDGTVRSTSTVVGYVSALKFHFKEKKIDIPPSLKVYFAEYHQGHKRIVAQLKNNSHMKKYEGKVPAMFTTYVRLAKAALFAAADRSQFASYVHCYLILCWNLFARSYSVSDLRTHHLSWENDCLVVDMSKHTADQTGEKITRKHIYANPWQPQICPILAIALQIFSTTFRDSNDQKTLIFLGAPYDLFTKWLSNALKSVPDLGHAASDYGTHSFRKGVTTFCSSLIGGPSVAAIFLRAGWSLGQVQDRYISSCDGGDQLCGRVAAGLNFNDGANFVVLPPHFEGSNVLTVEEWKLLCPLYDIYDVGFQSCLPYLLASLVYHWDWINLKNEDSEFLNIAANHPIFQSRIVVSGLIPRLKVLIISNTTNGRCELTGMTASGIPPHIEIQRRMEKLEEENLKLRQQLLDQYSNLLAEIPEKTAEMAVTKIMSTIEISGTQHVTPQNLDHAIVRLERFMEDRTTNSTVTQQQPLDVQNQIAINAAVDTYTYWTWGGKFRPVPNDWKMPKGTVKAICDMYYTGEPDKSIRPYKLIKLDLLPRKEQQYFAKFMNIMKQFRQKSIEFQLCGSEQQFDNTSLVQWDEYFKIIFNNFIAEINTKRIKSVARPTELKYVTFYDLINCRNAVAT